MNYVSEPSKSSQTLRSSTPNRINMDRSAFDMSIVPDLIPEQPEPKKPWKFYLLEFSAKAMVVLNHLIVITLVINNYYPMGKKSEDVKILSCPLDSVDYEAWRVEVFELKRYLADLWNIQVEINRWNENLHDIDSKINEAIKLYDADKIGRIDYALESSGAFIVSTPQTKSYRSNVTLTLFGIFRSELLSNPSAVIQQGISPGQCYAFEGSMGRIRIKLSEKIAVGSVTLEHAHRSLLADLSSTPKDFEVHGLFNEDDPHGTKLGEFQYQLNGEQLQTFQIENPGPKVYSYIELLILSNYGNPEYTCVYRFRVHAN